MESQGRGNCYVKTSQVWVLRYRDCSLPKSKPESSSLNEEVVWRDPFVGHDDRVANGTDSMATAKDVAAAVSNHLLCFARH